MQIQYTRWKRTNAPDYNSPEYIAVPNFGHLVGIFLRLRMVRYHSPLSLEISHHQRRKLKHRNPLDLCRQYHGCRSIYCYVAGRGEPLSDRIGTRGPEYGLVCYRNGVMRKDEVRLWVGNIRWLREEPDHVCEYYQVESWCCLSTLVDQEIPSP